MERKLLASLMEGERCDVNNTELARAIGCTAKQISKFFNYGTDLSFQLWLLSVRHLRPESESEVVEQLAEAWMEGGSPSNLQSLMEYASTTRNLDLLERLIVSQEDAPKKVRKQAELYRMVLDFQRRDYSSDDLLAQLDYFRPHSVENSVLAKILRAMVNYCDDDFRAMFRTAQQAEREVSDIKNEFIRESYMARISEILSKGYLYLRNDVRKARFYGNVVLNARFLSPAFKAHTLHLLGTSYIFEDCAESLRLFGEYADALDAGGRHELAQSVRERDEFFTRVLWTQEVSAEDSTDPLELMHYYAKAGDKEAVEKLYEQVPQDDPFALFHVGTVRNDPDMLIRSMAKFVEQGNKFLTELPRRALQGHPVHVPAGETIRSIRIA